MNYPKSKGIIQKLNNISPEETKKYFSITGNHSNNSKPIDVLLEYNNKHWWYGASPEPSFVVNLNDGYGIHLTHILLRSGDANFPKSFNITAVYNEESYLIDSHNDTELFHSTYTSISFNIKQGYYTSFNYTMTGDNAEGYRTFCLSFVDFYGILTDSEGKPIVVAPYYYKVKTCKIKIFHHFSKYLIYITLVCLNK